MDNRAVLIWIADLKVFFFHTLLHLYLSFLFWTLNITTYINNWGFCLHLKFFSGPHCMACRSLVPQPGIEPIPLQWKCGNLTAGPPEKSPWLFFFFFNVMILERIFQNVCYFFSFNTAITWLILEVCNLRITHNLRISGCQHCILRSDSSVCSWLKW